MRLAAMRRHEELFVARLDPRRQDEQAVAAGAGCEQWRDDFPHADDESQA